MLNFLELATEYIKSGLSVIPVKLDKRPMIGTWEPFQKRIPTLEEVAIWEKLNPPGIAVIAGKVSGNLTCLDFDLKHDGEKVVFREFTDLLKEWGRDDILPRCVIEKTPSGGYHVLFRSDFVRGNEKLATDKGKMEAMIEIKGEGGYFVCGPTPGWEIIKGKLSALPVITGEEGNLLIAACWALDRRDTPDAVPVPKEKTTEGKSPFDDYMEREGAETMLSDLMANGWRKVGSRGENIHLCRPGKDGRDTSATLHQGRRVFYVFSSSSEFEPRKGYSAVGVYTALNHHGDFKAAARDLVQKGYGEKRERVKVAVSSRPLELKQRLLIEMSTLDNEVMENFKKGADNGIETEWKGFEYRIASNQLTVVTGYPSSGKSSFIQSIAVHLAAKNGWRFVIASMEDYPNSRLAGKLIRKYTKKQTLEMQPEEYRAGWEWVKSHFVFVNAAADDVSLSRILDETVEMNQINRIHGLILDPWSEMDEDRPAEMTETEFVKISLKKARKFARANDTHVWILAHPTKPRRNQDGSFPDVDLYDIAGSHHWRAKADNGLVVKRNMETNVSTVHIQKIKFSDYGRIGASMDFSFNIPIETYYSLSGGKPERVDQKTAATGERDVW